jgi:hypothetical protein
MKRLDDLLGCLTCASRSSVSFANLLPMIFCSSVARILLAVKTKNKDLETKKPLFKINNGFL